MGISLAKLSTGTTRVDFNCDILIALIDDFEEARKAGAADDILDDHLSEIAEFAKFQFLREEHILARQNSKEIEHHRKRHCEFIEILFNISLSQRLGYSRFSGAAELLLKCLADHYKHDYTKPYLISSNETFFAGKDRPKNAIARCVEPQNRKNRQVSINRILKPMD